MKTKVWLIVLCVFIMLLFAPVSAIVENMDVTRSITPSSVVAGGEVNVTLTMKTRTEAMTGAMQEWNISGLGWSLHPVWNLVDADYQDDPVTGVYYINRTLGINAKDATWSDVSKDWAWTTVTRTAATYFFNYYIKVPASTPPGPYTIEGNGINDGRVKNITGDSTVTVLTLPGASYTTTNLSSAYEPMTLLFTDTSTGGPMTSRCWTFGDGNTSWEAGGAITSFTHTFVDNGLYTPSLRVVNAVGPNTAVSGGNTPIDVRVQPNASAMFTFAPTSVLSGEPVVFTDLSLNATYWRWSFNDGNSSYLNQSCSHIFPTVPTDRIYNVSLNVSGIRGGLSNITFDVPVIAALPLPNYTSSNLTSAYEPMTLLFTDTSAGGPMITRIWNFGDGNSSWSAGAATTSFTHTFIDNGLYTPILTVTNGVGPSTVTSGGNTPIDVRVQPNASAMFAFSPASVLSGEPVVFTDLSLNATYWRWSFNDGNSSYLNRSCSHIFPTVPTDRIYNVSLNVSGIRGGLSNITFDVPVIAALPLPNYTSSNLTSAYDPMTLLFTDTSTGGSITSRIWNFGDGNSSWSAGAATTVFTHTYQDPGSYTPILTVTNGVGPSTVTSGGNTPIDVRVQPNATPMFTYTPPLGGSPMTVIFTDTSLNATYWVWDFGDGNSSWVSQHATHTFTAATDTVYNVRHSVRGVRGGLSNVTFPVDVRAGFSATFDANITTGVVTGAGQAVNFTFLTPGASNWTWNFGDNSVFTNSHAGKIPPLVNHTYTQNGTFSVSLVANDTVLSNGNLTRGNYITFGLAPVAGFVPASIVTAPNTGLTFTNTSQNVVNYIASQPPVFTWDWGDGNVTTSSASHSYSQVGIYTVTLTVTNNRGTSAPYTQDIEVKQVVTETTPVITAVNFTLGGAGSNQLGINISTFQTTGVGTLSIVGSDIYLTNMGPGVDQVLIQGTGITNTSGNINGTITSVTTIFAPQNTVINGTNIVTNVSVIDTNYNPGATVSIGMTGLDDTNRTAFNGPAYLDGLMNETAVTMEVIPIGFTAGARLNLTFAIPADFVARNSRLFVMARHADNSVESILINGAAPFSTYVSGAVTYNVYKVDTTFSIFAVVGVAAAPSAPAPGPGPAGGGGGGSGGSASARGYVSSKNSATMLQSDEGKVLQPNLIVTGQEASLYIPLGTTVLGKDGKPVSTVSVETVSAADVPAVPAGATYSFAGYAVEGSPEGTTFNPAVSLTFSLTANEWNDVMAMANGNAGYLTVMYYDPAHAEWVGVPTKVDQGAHTVTGSVSHFSTYGVFVDTTAVSAVAIEATPTMTQIPRTAAPTVAPVKTMATPTAPAGEIPWTLIFGVFLFIVIIAGAGYYFIVMKEKR